MGQVSYTTHTVSQQDRDKARDLTKRASEQNALADASHKHAKAALKRCDYRAFEAHASREAGYRDNANNAHAEARRLLDPYGE